MVVSLMMISSFAVKNTSDIFQTTTKVLYGCKSFFDGRICQCQLALHAKYFNELRKWMIVSEQLETEEMKELTMVQF